MGPREIQLKNQKVEVVDCKECNHDMVNIDADQLAAGDLAILKAEKVRISNPETEDPICLNCEAPRLASRLRDWFDSEDDDDDSSFFSAGTGLFGGSSSSGGFGGFGGFGGGFSGGGGAGRAF